MTSNQYPFTALGCKRIVFDSGYLKALNLSNIQLNYDGIEAVTSDGIITKTGMFLNMNSRIN